MSFKELQQDYSVYLLDKGNMECREAKVVSVSAPRFDNKIGQQPSMVVDLTLDDGGKVNTYVVNESASKAFAGNTMLSIERADIVHDIKAIKRSSEQALSEIEKHHGIINKCDQLLANLDVEYKEKQAMETRLDKIEEMLAKLIEQSV